MIATTDLEGVDVRTPVLAGVGFVALFVAVFGGWSVFAKIESAAIAPGLVTVETQRKTVQHLEGGIVAALDVQEGDSVDAGQVLLRLERTQAEAQADFIRSRYYAALALEARLSAERDDGDSIVFPAELVEKKDRADVAAMLASQVEIRKTRDDLLQDRIRILEQGIAEYGEELKGLDNQIASFGQRIDSLNVERDGFTSLAATGLVPRAQLREVERQLAEVEGERAATVGRSSQLRQSITESRLKINELRTSDATEVVEDLRDVQGQIFELREQLRAAEDVLARTEIRAPISGKVVGLKVHTTGGVITPGAPLMDIVPSEDVLVVEARVDPSDIDVVQVGQAAQVRLTALNRREAPPVDGTVIAVSADAFTVERGRSFYVAKVKLDAASLRRAMKDKTLLPGMETEVLILTGARTPLDYLFEPLLRSVNRAMREG